MKLKAILAPGLLALAASDAVQAGTASDAYSAFQEALTKSDDLRTSLQRMDADPSSDGPAIYDYYSDRKKHI